MSDCYTGRLHFNSSRYPLYQLIQKGLPSLIPQVRQQAVAEELGGVSKHR